MGVLKPDLIFKSIVPIIMAGILGIYGLIVAVILNNKGKKVLRGVQNSRLLQPECNLLTLFMNLVSVTGAQNFEYKYGDGYKHLASGLVCGLSSLVSYINRIIDDLRRRIPSYLLMKDSAHLFSNARKHVE
jgi:V-type H+-transporting ATPase proteolipid subunit